MEVYSSELDSSRSLGQLDVAAALEHGDARAALVLEAARPWSPASHALWPAAARRQAVNLLLVGSRLARLRHGTDTLLDIWTISVIPFVVCRTT